MTTAAYPGAFDPITRGHIDIARRAAKVFGRLVVAVGDNPAKEPLFSREERMEMARAELQDVPNITIDSFGGLLVDYLRSHEISVVVRGIRTPSDLEYESCMALTNRAMLPGLETVFMRASPEYAFVNGRLLKEVAPLGGDISTLVPPGVAERLRKKLGGPPAHE